MQHQGSNKVRAGVPASLESVLRLLQLRNITAQDDGMEKISGLAFGHGGLIDAEQPGMPLLRVTDVLNSIPRRTGLIEESRRVSGPG